MLISSVINIIKNSQKSNYFSCSIPFSLYILKFVKLLFVNGLINGFTLNKKKRIELYLKYNKHGKGFLSNLQICSTSSRQIYKRNNHCLKSLIYSGYIISSPGKLSLFFFSSVFKNKNGKIIAKF
jgi:ribosomal protein S8